MKKFLLAAVLLSMSFCSFAEDYSPTTLWPYLYPDFTEGTIAYGGGGQVKAHLNVHLLKGDLHFLKDDLIMVAEKRDLKSVSIGDDTFFPVDGMFMKVVNGDEGACVLMSVLGDFDALFTGTGAYGTSANTQAVTNLSSIEIGGINVTNHSKLLQDKREASGREIGLKEKLYIKVGDKCSAAFQKDVEQSFGISANGEWKSFLKKEKIKWRKPDDLIKVAQWLANKK